MSRFSHSLRARLLAWLLIATGVMGVLALIDTWRDAVETAQTVSDRVLAGSALAIAERVVVAEDGALEVDIPYVALEMLTSAAQDRVFYRVDGPPGTFITGYQGLQPVAVKEGQATGFTDAAFRGQPIRTATLLRSASTGIRSVPFTVTVAETTIARRQLSDSILLDSALRLAMMILGAAVIVWVSVTVSLRPLYRLSEAIAERNPDDLHAIDQAAPSEVEGLVDTVNGFMARLSAALKALRQFTGNASHQLRTPLAVVRTQLALALRASSLEEARAAIRKGDEAVARAERILAQLLTLARLDAAVSGGGAVRAPIDLTRTARQATAELVPAAAEAGLDLGFEGETETAVLAEPLLIGELLRNLIENAIAYGGRGAEVTVRCLPDGAFARLEVEDDGPGIAPERREAMLTRFERDGGETKGMGLGLPIVEEIAALYGGAVRLESGANGRGLKVAITLPLACP